MGSLLSLCSTNTVQLLAFGHHSNIEGRLTILRLIQLLASTLVHISYGWPSKSSSSEVFVLLRDPKGVPRCSLWDSLASVGRNLAKGFWGGGLLGPGRGGRCQSKGRPIGEISRCGI